MEYIKKIKIGNVELNNNVFLAPMAGITDLPFRTICKKFGAGLVYTEMISSKGIYYNDDKTKKLMEIDREERPIGVQIFGSDPYIMGHIAEKVSSEADIIDINMGCPAPKVTKNKEGSALMLDLELVSKITKVVVEKSKVPVTVKIRKGFDENNINAIEVAKIAEQNGVAAITVHGRLRSEFYSGKSDLEIIKKVKDSVKIPVIGNGDIVDVESTKRMFEYTNCDAIMIGRGALGNPWIFKSIIDEKKYIPSTLEIKNMIYKHMKMLTEHKGEYTAIREMRKQISWYIKGIPNATEIRDRVNRAENYYEVEEILNKYLI